MSPVDAQITSSGDTWTFTSPGHFLAVTLQPPRPGQPGWIEFEGHARLSTDALRSLSTWVKSRTSVGGGR